MAARALSLLLAFASAAGASAWAALNVSEQRQNATVALLVSNRAAVDVVLDNCDDKHAVPAGGHITLHLSGQDGYWVVPNNVAWTCDEGPFDLFFVGTELGGPDLLVTVGYGLPDGEDGNEPGITKDPVAGNWSSEVAGLELDMGSAAGDVVLRCRADSCDQGNTIKTLPDSFALNIMGPQASLLSFWRVGERPTSLAARGGGGGRGGGHAGMPGGAYGAGRRPSAPVAGGR